jgi:hypothetical protein
MKQNETKMEQKWNKIGTKMKENDYAFATK